MGDHERAAAHNRARQKRHRERLRVPELIEEDMTTQILKRNGYAADTAGMIESYRCHASDALVSWDRGLVPSQPLRYGHQHLAIIRIDTSDAKLVDAVAAALDEPCLVGANDAGAVLVFRIGDSGYGFEVGSPPTAAHEFVTSDGKAGLFTATAYAQPLDVAAYVWRDERSPLNTHLMLLPPMHLDIAQAASGAVGDYLRDNGGRWGPLVLPEDPMQASIRRGRAIMAARAAISPEEEAARADEALVARNPELRVSDGVQGRLVHQARQRIESRKAAERAEKEEKKRTADKAKLKALLEKSV
jgi:hypothetical protein